MGCSGVWICELEAIGARVREAQMHEDIHSVWACKQVECEKNHSKRSDRGKVECSGVWICELEAIGVQVREVWMHEHARSTWACKPVE